MLNELLPTDLLNGDGTIKPEAQATILSGTQTSNNGFSPLQQAQQEISMNLMDYLNRKAPGSSYAALMSTKLKQRDDADEYNQKLIKRRNTGIGALMKIPSSKRQQAYPKLLEMLRDQGADVGMPEQYDEETLSLMKGEDSDWAAKEYLKHQYRLAEIAARGTNSEKDYYDIESQKKAAGENIKLLSDINRTEQGLPQLKIDLEKARSLAPKASFTGLERARDFIASPFVQTEGDENKSLLETKLKSNIIPRIMSIIQDRYTAEEAKQVINNLYKESDSPKVKIEKINSFYEKELADLDSKKKQVDALVKQTGYGTTKFNNQNIYTKPTTEKTDYKSKYGLD